MKQELMLLMTRTVLVVPVVATVDTVNYSILLKLIVCFMFYYCFYPLFQRKELNIQNSDGFFVQYIFFKSKTCSDT